MCIEVLSQVCGGRTTDERQLCSSWLCCAVSYGVSVPCYSDLLSPRAALFFPILVQTPTSASFSLVLFFPTLRHVSLQCREFAVYAAQSGASWHGGVHPRAASEAGAGHAQKTQGWTSRHQHGQLACERWGRMARLFGWKR
jgi:hypothetical protein